MTLSLRGRLETRVFLVLTVGVVWTIGLTTVRGPASYRSNLTMLALMGAIGVGWELLYHALQQLRWDKDWPSIFAALAVINEGALLWTVVGWIDDPAVQRGSPTSFVGLVGSTWLAMWLFMQGPMRVVFLRWRLRGGRILCSR